AMEDTVIGHDRVSENQRPLKTESLESVINRPMNPTLSPTILTSGATMLVCVALFFLRGEVLNTFALTLIIGIVVGTYSSIYVAAAIVVIWKEVKGRRRRLKAVLAPVTAAHPDAPASRGSYRQYSPSSMHICRNH